jgi:hypothetical protein
MKNEDEPIIQAISIVMATQSDFARNILKIVHDMDMSTDAQIDAITKMAEVAIQLDEQVNGKKERNDITGNS